MADNIGYAFAPGIASIPLGKASPSPIGGPQSAVQVKSLTIPQRNVPGQIAPQALLQSPGGGGAPDVDIIRQLLQAFAPQAAGIQHVGASDANAGSGYGPLGQLFGMPTPGGTPQPNVAAPTSFQPPPPHIGVGDNPGSGGGFSFVPPPSAPTGPAPDADRSGGPPRGFDLGNLFGSGGTQTLPNGDTAPLIRGLFS